MNIKKLFIVALSLGLGFAAQAGAQLQIVTPDPTQAIAQVGDRVTTTVVYSTSPVE